MEKKLEKLKGKNRKLSISLMNLERELRSRIKNIKEEHMRLSNLKKINSPDDK